MSECEKQAKSLYSLNHYPFSPSDKFSTNDTKWVPLEVALAEIQKLKDQIEDAKNTWAHCYEQLKNETDYEMKKLGKELEQAKQDIDTIRIERNGYKYNMERKAELFVEQKNKAENLEGQIGEANKILLSRNLPSFKPILNDSQFESWSKWLEQLREILSVASK